MSIALHGFLTQSSRLALLPSQTIHPSAQLGHCSAQLVSGRFVDRSLKKKRAPPQSATNETEALKTQRKGYGHKSWMVRSLRWRGHRSQSPRCCCFYGQSSHYIDPEQ